MAMYFYFYVRHMKVFCTFEFSRTRQAIGIIRIEMMKKVQIYDTGVLFFHQVASCCRITI